MNLRPFRQPVNIGAINGFSNNDVITRTVTPVVHGGAGAITTNVTISSVGSMSNAMVLMTGRTTSNNSVNSATLRLTSATNIEIITRSSAAATINVAWELIISSNLYVQRGNLAKVHGGAGELTTNTTISTISDITKVRTHMNGALSSINDYSSSSSQVTTTTNIDIRTWAIQAMTVTTNWVAWRYV